MQIPTNFIPTNIKNIQSQLTTANSFVDGAPLQFTGDVSSLTITSTEINNTLTQKLQASLQSGLPDNMDAL